MDDNIDDRLTKANYLINSFMTKHNIDPLSYNWEIFANDLSEKYKIKWIGYELGVISRNTHAGALGVNRKKNRIFYNSTMYKGRINFTICHELSHFIWDSDYGRNTSYFGSSLLAPYTEEEMEIEQITDSSAGVLMLPDITIVRFLETNISFPKMGEMMQMSQAALYVRLVQFLEQHLHISNERARKLINQLRYDGKRDSIHRSLIGAYTGVNAKREIIYSYENS